MSGIDWDAVWKHLMAVEDVKVNDMCGHLSTSEMQNAIREAVEQQLAARACPTCAKVTALLREGRALRTKSLEPLRNAIILAMEEEI